MQLINWIAVGILVSLIIILICFISTNLLNLAMIFWGYLQFFSLIQPPFEVFLSSKLSNGNEGSSEVELLLK